MNDSLSDLLEDYLQRRAAGETPAPEEYREQAGAHYATFVELVAAESALDTAMGLEAPMPLPRSFGAYTLLRELGRGAVGVVYEALHRDLGRTVALKVLRTGFDTTPLAITRFRREAVACAQVRHDHIVEVYEAGAVEGRPFYTMALLEGDSLAQLAKARPFTSPRDFCRHLAGVADALHTLHEKGIIHRDVKPSNIMVEPSGRMVLADFGLARNFASTSLTKSGEALGTPLYMSPEQLLGRRDEINRRSDVYGLGATMYEVLAGRRIFTAEDMQTMIRQILQERPAPLREVAPHLSTDCERIVMKAVEKRNEDRYETAGAMRDDLLAYADGRGVAGRPVSGVRRAMRQVRHRWKPLAVAAGALASATVWYFNRSATLRVECYPVAELLLDGSPRGTTPKALTVSPGEHKLTLRTGGFVAKGKVIYLDPGEQRSLQLVLIAADPEDPEALEKLAKEFKLAMAKLEETERQRDMDESGVLALFPRGPVRLKQDLGTYRIDVGTEFGTPGTLRFRVGGKTLYAHEFDPVGLSTVRALPAEVLHGVEIGDVVTWGFYPADPDAKPATAEFLLVAPGADGVAAELSRMEPVLKKQDPLLAGTMRANLFLKHGLFYAAFREATATLADGRPCAHACAVMQAALHGMKLEEGARAWVELNERIDSLPLALKKQARRSRRPG